MVDFPPAQPNFAEGDLVSNTTNLATLTQNDALEVNISLPIEKAPRLGIGTRVELLNQKGQVLGTSRVFFISPKVSNDTQSVLVKARVENNSGKLRADQFIETRVIWKRLPSILVPTTAISRVAEQNFVFVAEQGKDGLVAKQTPVKLGIIRGNAYQVMQGLKANDRIVTSGLLKIRDGAAIVPEQQNAPTEKKS
ncbi:efflux RND transporter periplasmic adaptor subunit [Leptolyngbya sp. FACHB-36]|uniref:efflux RND transporter periplasmic adaptor subunit n=1 Tax=Leptolyngbya sp. FACHB-36 TaxID=2692808 RepID=UPI001680FFF3|nr:efflux RND transporter periplasmic adaptor subunit [Leptolyngbya sp. FACHB-36]